jgi:L-proline amide hydrolase
MPIPRATEGYVPFRGYRTWYQVVGDIPAAGPKLPLLVVHGGPGFPMTISATWPG